MTDRDDGKDSAATSDDPGAPKQRVFIRSARLYDLFVAFRQRRGKMPDEDVDHDDDPVWFDVVNPSESHDDGPVT